MFNVDANSKHKRNDNNNLLEVEMKKSFDT